MFGDEDYVFGEGNVFEGLVRQRVAELDLSQLIEFEVLEKEIRSVTQRKTERQNMDRHEQRKPSRAKLTVLSLRLSQAFLSGILLRPHRLRSAVDEDRGMELN